MWFFSCIWWLIYTLFVICLSWSDRPTCYLMYVLAVPEMSHQDSEHRVMEAIPELHPRHKRQTPIIQVCRNFTQTTIWCQLLFFLCIFLCNNYRKMPIFICYQSVIGYLSKDVYTQILYLKYYGMQLDLHTFCDHVKIRDKILSIDLQVRWLPSKKILFMNKIMWPLSV